MMVTGSFFLSHLCSWEESFSVKIIGQLIYQVIATLSPPFSCTVPLVLSILYGKKSSSGVCKLHFSKVLLWGWFLPPVSPFPVSQKLCVPLGRAVLTPVSLVFAAANRVAAVLAPELGSGGQSHGAAANSRLLHTCKSFPSPNVSWNEHHLLQIFYFF